MRFEPGSSHTAVRHATARPLRLGSRWPEVFHCSCRASVRPIQRPSSSRPLSWDPPEDSCVSTCPWTEPTARRTASPGNMAVKSNGERGRPSWTADREPEDSVGWVTLHVWVKTRYQNYLVNDSGRISYGTSETMANTDKRLSYRRETRATLCICWNVVVLLYELCYSVTGIVLYTRRCSRLNYSTASMRWSVTHTCNAEVSRTCDKQNFHHDQRCWWYRVFLRQRTVEQLYSPREVAYYK